MTTTTEKTWYTQDGRQIPISQMEDSHLLSTLKMLEGQAADSTHCQKIVDSIQELLEACQQDIKEPCHFFQDEYAIDHDYFQDTIRILETRLTLLEVGNPSGIHFLYPDLLQEAVSRGLV